jgi:hypothetical protein
MIKAAVGTKPLAMCFRRPKERRLSWWCSIRPIRAKLSARTALRARGRHFGVESPRGRVARRYPRSARDRRRRRPGRPPLPRILRRHHPQQKYPAAARFFAWCDHHKISEIADIEPVHVAAYIEALGKDFEKPTVKQHLAAIRMLFDWLVVKQVVAINPAHSVRGPKHVVKTGKTTVLTGEQARELLDSIDTSTVVGLRDRALISVMTFALPASARPSPCVSRIIFRRANAGGFGCTTKAASATKCRRITIS